VTEIYQSLEDLTSRFESAVRQAKLVIVGSFVPDGARVGDWVTSIARGRTAFYDIDTPVTLAQLANGETEYITPSLIRRYDVYLSFTGGPVLRFLESHYGSPMARVLYCSVDAEKYQPQYQLPKWDLGYLGTYSSDRQPTLNSLLVESARQWPQGAFTVVGPMYPEDIDWPKNVQLQMHLSPAEHPAFYGAQRFSLNVTRVEMKKRGFSPSVRLFEAGACAIPVISDWWEGLDGLFSIGKEVLISDGPEDTLRYLRDIRDAQRIAIGTAARLRVLAEHTAGHRAIQLENYLREINDNALPDTARRNGRSGQLHNGLAAGLPSQSHRESTRGTVGSEVVALSDQGNIYQPAGAGRGNRAAGRRPSGTGTAPVE